MPGTVGLPLPAILLRAVEFCDVPVLFEYQLDDDANRMAGTKPRTAEVFQALWDRILNDPDVVARVIVSDDRVVGGISCFEQDGQRAVGYWIGKQHWSKGIASRALAQFLEQVKVRPLHATVARENAASMRVLEKCGFRVTGWHIGEDTERYIGCEVATLVLE